MTRNALLQKNGDRQRSFAPSPDSGHSSLDIGTLSLNDIEGYAADTSLGQSGAICEASRSSSPKNRI